MGEDGTRVAVRPAGFGFGRGRCRAAGACTSCSDGEGHAVDKTQTRRLNRDEKITLRRRSGRKRSAREPIDVRCSFERKSRRDQTFHMAA